jgi:uncharacterized protein
MSGPFRRNKALFSFLLIALLFVAPRKAVGEEGTFPNPVGFVNDFAGIIPERERDEIESLCADLERRTTVEIAVVTLKSTGSIPIEDYANELFNRWGIGKKGKDNGVLILVAVDDRKVRIEVGYGLEPILTDARAGDIIRHVLAPEFRRGDFGKGLLSAVRYIGELVEGKGAPEAMPSEDLLGSPISYLAYYLFLLCFSLITGGLVLLSLVGISIAIVALPLFLLGITANISAGGALYLIPLIFMIVGLIAISILKSVKASGLKKKYGRGWTQHFPWWWYGAPYSGGGTVARGGGGWSFGGFGGGSSGGGGASGSW